MAMKKISTTVRFWLFPLIVITFATPSVWAYLLTDQVYHDNRIDFYLDTDFYKTTSNFDSSGSKTDLPFSNSFQIINVTPQIRWVVFHDLGLRVGANVGDSQSSDTAATRSNSTFNRFDLGADYLLFDHTQFETILDFEYSGSLQQVVTNADDALNNNGASEVKPTLILRMNLDGFTPWAYVGGNFRDQGLSSLVTYGVGGEFHLSSFGLGADLKGYSSVTNDKYTNQASVRESLTARVDAGSKLYYSINPNLLTTDVFVNYALTDNFKVKFYGGYDVAGSNISQGFTVGGTINFSFNDAASEKRSEHVEHAEPVQPRPKHRKKKVVNANATTPDTGFKEDTNDGVDQNYFKPVAPTDENYVKPIDHEGEDGWSKPQTDEDQIQNGTGSATDSESQKALDQMGYQIKLKKLKKKKATPTNTNSDDDRTGP